FIVAGGDCAKLNPLVNAKKKRSFVFIGQSNSLPRQRIKIDIAAAENEADALTDDVDLALDYRGVRDGTRRLDDDFHRLPNLAHRRDDRFLAHGHDIIDKLAHDLEIGRANIRAQSIGDGVRLDADDF